jgi:hypothetical protein
MQPLISTDSVDNSTESSLPDETGDTGEAEKWAQGIKRTDAKVLASAFSIG